MSGGPPADQSGSNSALSQVTPELGSQTVSLAFVSVGTLSAIIWDILSNIGTDFHILCHFPMSLAIIVYFLSRFAALAAFIVIAIVSTQHMENCIKTIKLVSWMLSVSLSSTTLLFFLRVRGIYADKPYVVGFFFLSWLGVVAGCIAETWISGPMKSEGENLPSGGYCTAGPMDLFPLVTTMSTIPMVNDILSFCAISWRLVRFSPAECSFRKGLCTLISGRYLPALSKALLKDGQVYFLSTVTLSLLSTTLYYINGLPRIFSAALVFPNIAVMNLMGCRVFRNTKIGLHALRDGAQGPLEFTSLPIAFQTPIASQEESEGGIV